MDFTLNTTAEIIAICVPIATGICIGIDAATPIATGPEIVIVLHVSLATLLILAACHHHRAMLRRTCETQMSPDLGIAGITGIVQRNNGCSSQGNEAANQKEDGVETAGEHL